MAIILVVEDTDETGKHFDPALVRLFFADKVETV